MTDSLPLVAFASAVLVFALAGSFVAGYILGRAVEGAKR